MTYCIEQNNLYSICPTIHPDLGIFEVIDEVTNIEFTSNSNNGWDGNFTVKSYGNEKYFDCINCEEYTVSKSIARVDIDLFMTYRGDHIAHCQAFCRFELGKIFRDFLRNFWNTPIFRYYVFSKHTISDF